MRAVFAFCAILQIFALQSDPLHAVEQQAKRLSQWVAPLGPPYNEPRNFGPVVAVNDGRVAFPDATLQDGRIVVADVETGETLAELFHPLDAKIRWKQMGLQIAMNETFIVSSGYTESYYPGSRRHGEFLIFDAETFEHLRTIRSPKDKWTFGFGEGLMQLDGSRLAIMPFDYKSAGGAPLYVFDVGTGDLIWTLRDPKRRPGFGRQVSLRGDHILLSTGYESVDVELYKIGEDTPVATFASPETMKGATLTGQVLLTDDLVLIGGAVPTKIRIILDRYADIGKLYAFERDGGALRYTIDDPFPPNTDAKPAAYAAATGRATPFYGSGFPGGLERMGDRFIAGLPSYREAHEKEGALIGFDTATGEQSFMVKRDDTVAGRYFAQFFAVHGSLIALIAVYHRASKDDIERDAISVFSVD